jgi:hypothetical protein
MAIYPHQKNGEIEINDLVSEAIANATERRNQAAEADLSKLSAEEIDRINGGASIKIILGIFFDTLNK